VGVPNYTVTRNRSDAGAWLENLTAIFLLERYLGITCHRSEELLTVIDKYI
jgi:hypothetical protein